MIKKDNTQNINITSGVNCTMIAGTFDTIIMDSALVANFKYCVDEKNLEEEIRNNNPVVKEAYEQYQLLLKMCRDEEIDKSFEKRYGVKNGKVE